jgi:hypothetical protein
MCQLRFSNILVHAKLLVVVLIINCYEWRLICCFIVVGQSLLWKL